ncbi:class I adenylate-forming enzyme family protein [Mangrovihabitans endophyticus]|uniref:Long-chain-fatty-acid--CoA ligase n=1 Tax=Mangrovihabitans endophyticus TaxID=1751298 RepID=A0A8J3BW67_9ACTN|nr:AMP-binding protein [Mangrovihabitans endophyticus]GGK72823.1 long-chain-fatty-acid--CoA ligase [Mangrovihabitans endophyticus]
MSAVVAQRTEQASLVPTLLDRAARERPEATAVRDPDGALTYAALVQMSWAACTWFAEQGVAPGDRIAIQAAGRRLTIAALFGCLRLGAVAVPYSPEMTSHQLAYLLADTDPTLLIDDRGPLVRCAVPRATSEDFAAGLAAVLERPAAPAAPPGPAPDDLALLLYTSGSTAQPKGVACTHAQICFAAGAIAQRVVYRPDDVVFCRLPLSFDYGLYQVFLSAIAGCTLVLADAAQHTDLIRQLASHGATVMPLVPSLATMLLALSARLPAATGELRLRLFTNTGEHLPPATADALRARFPGSGVQMMFGISECKRITIAEVDGYLTRPGSVGRALPGTQVWIRDPAGELLAPGETGEICVTGPHLMEGYWNAPELTAQRYRLDPTTGERVLHTGDFGRLDADGQLYFEGRRDQIFKLRGVRISTTEIEAAAAALPGVRTVAMLPPVADREATLCVAGEVTAEEVLRRLRELLGPAKTPPRCRALPALPLTRNGKVDRIRLDRMVQGSET